jgi:SynChlorMet cassette radical SAM/SPASM protein ScmE
MTSKIKQPIISTPQKVNIQITGKCNLKCQYCFYANEMTDLTDLSTKQWQTIFAKLGNLGAMNVCLSGGEPFTRPDLFDLIDSIIKNRMRYSILSNGTLLDEKTVEKFSFGKRRLRLDYLQVSIDGSRAEIHDQSRPKSFDRAVQGLRLLKKAGFPLAVRVTINRHNLGDLENIAHFLLNEIGLPSFSTNDAMPIGSGCHNEAQVSLTPTDQVKAMGIMDRLLKKYPDRIKANAGPLARRKMYAEMEHARRTGEKSSSWSMGYLSACGCVFSTIDILHDGSIVPCCMLPGLVLGNILNDPIEKIWQEHRVLWQLRNRRSIPMSEVPGCENCEWVPYCNGSCPGLTHQLTGVLNRANPIDCYRLFLHETGETHAL